MPSSLTKEGFPRGAPAQASDVEAERDARAKQQLLRPVAAAPMSMEHLVDAIRAALRTETSRSCALDMLGSYQRLAPLIEPLLEAYARSGAVDWHR